MVFIPMVAHRATPPSARAIDLARRLQAEIEKFDREYPGTSKEDLRTAAAIAIGDQGGRTAAPRKAVAAVLGIVTAALGAGLAIASASDPGGISNAMPVAVAVLLAAGVAAFAIARPRRE